ncbi:hydroxymethylbilane synthase [uncultured Clostridium sp.]|uniref:hydroxymethylbilane synthase n=1 Tax=uncultured Clostridium sp. TaxID=59620 RepID=UPI002593FD3A|nr:hydroxymethylbilane synthase [uncultured Clostridium sp.]
MTDKNRIRVGSRDSALAVVQSKMAIAAMQNVCPETGFELITMKTTGDKVLDRPLDAVGGRGLFVKELDQALYEGRCELTVHSLKDMPLCPPEELPVLALLEREDCRDVLVLREGLSELPAHPVIGTSSRRRVLQGQRLFPDAEFKGIRGNLNTRLRKLDSGEYDALILAAAGLIRLGFADRISRYFSVEEMIPSAGQGILAIQGRRDREIPFVKMVHSEESAILTRAEQGFVATLGGGCSSPTAASAVLENGKIKLRGLYYKEETGEVRIGSIEGDAEKAAELGRKLAEQLSGKPALSPLGKVYLIGSGPGDVGLFTLRGRELLEQADAVVYDALAGDAVLGWIPEHTRKIDVGKRSGRHSKKQEEILEILLEEAKKGGTIVRLKGGDPFVFGRGGEEAEFLKKHQIPFEVVPGISSSLAVPAYFGIPVTHRGLAGSFHVITGHRMEGMPALDFEALARVGGTLIFLMSVANAPRICEGLLSAGMKPEMPAAFLMNGTLASQRMIRATLQTLPEEGVRQGVKAPAILVIGEVCALADTCAWREEKPLAGKRIVITRPKERSQKLAEHLRDAGAEVLEFPTIELKPVWKKSEKADAGTADKEKLYELVRNLESYHWLVLTSPAGAQYFFELLNQMQKDFRSLSHLRFAVIGEGTASGCREHGIYPDYIPERFYAADLGKGLAKRVKQNERVCILRARHGSPELTQAFEAAGISYMDVTLYDTITPKESPLAARIRELLKEGAIDAVTFTSGSTVQGFLDILQPDKETLNGFTAVCIGEKTEKTASAAGMKAVLAESVSEEGIEQALYHM